MNKEDLICLMLRLDPALHKRLARMAKREARSLNNMINQLLKKVVD